MPKQVRFIFSSLAGVVFVFAALSLPSALSQQSRQPTTTTASRNAGLVAATNEVLKETSEIRQLSILRPVRSSAQSRAEIERMIMKNLDEETTPAQMHAVEVTLKKLGLAPADFQYRALMVGLLTEQVAGYYDPKTREFHLADWIDLDAQRPIIAHELTHALQDQHFNLRRFEHWPKGDSDAEMAAHALIEGDATLAMSLYVMKDPLRALALLKSLGTASMSSVEFEKAPRAVRESLLFSYQEGLAWTSALYRRGGWDLVSKAFTDLPQSTEQILHPEKYFAHEAPVKVTLPERLTGWRRLDYDVQGEWGLYLILDQFLKSPAESRRAVAGWGGDRFIVYEGPKGQVLIGLLSAWDTLNDAREFFDAYVKRTELRYPRATLVNSPSQSAVRKRWQTGEGMVTIELRGSRVLVFEGLPGGVDLNPLQKPSQ